MHSPPEAIFIDQCTVSDWSLKGSGCSMQAPPAWAAMGHDAIVMAAISLAGRHDISPFVCLICDPEVRRQNGIAGRSRRRPICFLVTSCPTSSAHSELHKTGWPQQEACLPCVVDEAPKPQHLPAMCSDLPISAVHNEVLLRMQSQAMFHASELVGGELAERPDQGLRDEPWRPRQKISEFADDETSAGTANGPKLREQFALARMQHTDVEIASKFFGNAVAMRVDDHRVAYVGYMSASQDQLCDSDRVLAKNHVTAEPADREQRFGPVCRKGIRTKTRFKSDSWNIGGRANMRRLRIVGEARKRLNGARLGSSELTPASHAYLLVGKRR